MLQKELLDVSHMTTTTAQVEMLEMIWNETVISI